MVVRWSLKDLCDTIDRMQENKFDCIMFVEGSRGIGKTLGFNTNLKTHDNQTITSQTKQIGKLKDGELINTVSWDFKNNKYVLSKSRVIVEKEEKELFEVGLENGEKIVCSMEHRLFIKRNDKIIELQLKDIKGGDELVCLV